MESLCTWCSKKTERKVEVEEELARIKRLMEGFRDVANDVLEWAQMMAKDESETINDCNTRFEKLWNESQEK